MSIGGWRNGLALALGFILTLALLAGSLAWNLAEQQRRFQLQTENRWQLLAERIQQATAASAILATQFMAEQYVDADRFCLLASGLLRRWPFLNAAYYAPRVAPANRATFEAAVREQGLPGFRIRNEVTTKDAYPLRYFEPFTPLTARFLGEDLNADPMSATAIDEVIRVNEAMLVKTRVPSVDEPAYWLLRANYSNRAHPPAAQRRHLVTGIAGLSIKPSALAAELYDADDYFRLFLSNQHGSELLFENAADISATPFLLTMHYELPFASHHLLAEFNRVVSIRQLLGTSSMAALTLGILSTLLFWALATHATARRKAELALRQANIELEQRVLRRTAQLEAQTQRLTAEISERKQTEKALEQGNQRYCAIIETTTDGFWVMDKDGQLLEVNDAYCNMSGYARAELLGMHLYDLVTTAQADEVKRQLTRAIAQGGTVFESRQRQKDGEFRAMEMAMSYSSGANGHFFVFLRDIRERKFAEYLAELRDRLSGLVYRGNMEQLMQTALDGAEQITSSEIGFFHFVERDQQNISLQVWSTRTLREMCFAKGEGLHYPVSEAGIWVDCIHQRQPVIHNDYASVPHKKGLPEGHAPLLRELTVPVFRDNQIVAVIGVGNKRCHYSQQDAEAVSTLADMAFDFVERKITEQRIEFMAFNDALTGLPNRALLADRLKQAIAQHKRSNKLLGICYLDLDGFKPVNDQYGHDVGDELLIELARRLSLTMRDGDTLSRLGGDEFAFILNDLSASHESERVAQRLLDLVNSTFDIEGHQVHVSASIGITLYPLDDSPPDILLRHADQAMYRAKASGKGTYRLFEPVQEQEIRHHRRTLNSIVQSLTEDRFLLHYQPKIELSTGKVVGLEALIRWQHSERGLLVPGQFLTVIQGTPEEIALGEWVLKNALKQLAHWREIGIQLPVSVNISPNHIQMPGFADFLAKALAAHPEVDAKHLELEILETSAIGDIARVAEEMKACNRLGVRFSLDDFGTGYSSLAYFHRLPIDVLKIDQHFVSDMLDNMGNLDIVEGIIRLARTLNRPVVAEGVENIELGLLLLQLGGRYAQGYGIARPMSADKFPQWYVEWQSDNIWHQLHQEEYGDGDIELKVAIFSHRRWLRNIKRYLLAEDVTEELPPMETKHCQFVRWYNGLGYARYGNRPIYAFIPPKHNHVHELANILVTLYDQGKKQLARARLDELSDAGKALIAMLEKLAEH